MSNSTNPDLEVSKSSIETKNTETKPKINESNQVSEDSQQFLSEKPTYYSPPPQDPHHGHHHGHSHHHRGMSPKQKILIIGFTIFMPVNVLILEYFVSSFSNSF